MKIVKNVLSVIGIIALSGLFINAVVMPNENDATITKNEKLKNEEEGGFHEHYKIFALKVPDQLNFAGEKVPLEDPDVYERMDRELLVNTYWQSNGLLLIKRANKYFPIIEPILKKNGIPDDFKYLAVIESGLQNVVSPAGARGFWQLMSGTAKDQGLEVNDNVDERYNIVKATQAACEYIKESKERFGSWTLAAASYNAGQFGISKQLDRQKVDDYYDVLLGDETSRYVFRILAVKEILSHPKQYGFNYTQDDLYQNIPTYTVEVDTAVSDFADFAAKYGITYKTLKIHNPWLREAHLNNKSRKQYFIDIPEKGYYPAKK
ncbi:lytic transglycosylase domain-containing protein [Zhouia sp. PK063]|uniref:lytic transglycosylase domain-containing protein n=1 Tax=Zhouia sp. PK063 TaxID=3373602 RepID=UPI003797A118